jgi:hypothetical protein
MDDEDAFEMDPQGMRWIREPPMRESVSHQLITEFVIERWIRYWQNRKHCHAQSKCCLANRENSQAMPLREPGKSMLEGSEKSRASFRDEKSHQQKNQDQT